jgi:predicted anti-sigma-YlaC factor YlaD
MNSMDCGTACDLLPLLERGGLGSQQRAAVGLHLEDCGDCRAEAGIVALLAGAAPRAPAGLDERVLAAVRTRQSRRRNPARVAAAASVAIAVLGGSLLFQRIAGPVEPEPVATVVLEDITPALSWAVPLDPMLYGGPAFEHLSVEELELVLSEFDR